MLLVRLKQLGEEKDAAESQRNQLRTQLEQLQDHNHPRVQSLEVCAFVPVCLALYVPACVSKC